MQTVTRISLDTTDGPGDTRAPPLAALRGVMPPLLARLAAAWRARQTRAVLAELDDRILTDIGLTRSAAPRPAPSTALRDPYR